MMRQKKIIDSVSNLQSALDVMLLQKGIYKIKFHFWMTLFYKLIHLELNIQKIEIS